jgi:hypothetical protein
LRNQRGSYRVANHGNFTSFQWARGVVQQRHEQAPGLSIWLAQLLARAHQNVVIVALANKLVRMAWAVLCKNERYRAALSAARKGVKLSPEHRRNIGMAGTGKKRGPRSLGWTAKQSWSQKGMKRKPFTAEHRANLSASQKGVKKSPESCAARTGLKRSSESRAKMSAAQSFRRRFPNS